MNALHSVCTPCKHAYGFAHNLLGSRALTTKFVRRHSKNGTPMTPLPSKEDFSHCHVSSSCRSQIIINFSVPREDSDISIPERLFPALSRRYEQRQIRVRCPARSSPRCHASASKGAGPLCSRFSPAPALSEHLTWTFHGTLQSIAQAANPRRHDHFSSA